jgi:hypothetical protein
MILTNRMAKELFNWVRLPYELDIITSSGKDFDQWTDHSQAIRDGEHPKADCEDSALTWGSFAYTDFNVPRDRILLVRGRTPSCSPFHPFDHAWTLIDGRVFDIWETFANKLLTAEEYSA